MTTNVSKLPPITHKLNSRQKLVLINALKGMNQDKSYGEVYGFTVATQQRASELFRNPVFKAALERLQNKQIAIVEAQVLSKSEKRQLLAAFARAQLSDLLDDAGNIKFDKKSPAARALKEYYHKTKLDREGNPIVTKSMKLIDPIAAIMEDNKMTGDYAPSRHMVASKVQIEVVHTPRRIEASE